MWIVSDYAGVISDRPPQAATDSLARAVEVDPAQFWPVYWQERDPYDRGAVDAAGYWDRVCRRLDREATEDRVRRLAALDLRLATYLDRGTLTALRNAHDRRVPLALLSNAPREWARLIDRQPWAAMFTHRFFSTDLELAKPDPAIFREVCRRLGAEPEEITFVDDRRENVEAARTIGIDAVLFTGAARLSAHLARLSRGGVPGRQDGSQARAK
ncbi:HAD family hydrolase [Actinoallomurus rhizosphaericola]|uniref:HAD family hydrolase n=1 Tax=Actinoallomurus rhizosphaericola TaxID=2952536 RepID=UPI002092E880|nr:HAD-IA family hydrolase [Actinoallomurus rhizosphaericola]MCO5997070.1 HAD-IA family hydrolase [Actinoallomurus rhizosphaericola]